MMADTFKFELVSPEKLLLSADAVEVTVPGSEGDFGVFVHHAAVMSTLRPGIINAKLADGREESFFVRGGFADVSTAGLTLLSEFAIPASDFNAGAMEEQLELAHQELKNADGDAAKEKAQNLINQLGEVSATLAA